MKKLRLFFALLPLAVFSGCSESDPNSGEGPDGPETLTPVLHIVRGESFSLSCEEQDLSIVFRVDNPIGNGTVRLTGIPAWIHPYEGDETSISFTVDENEGGERRADMQLTYPQAESLTVTVLQAAAGNDRPDPGEVWRTGWPELPTEDKNNSDYYYAHHYCPDFKAGSYQARNYTVCFSAEHHCPVWVAAPRHSCYEGSASRTDAYGTDPQIPSNLQYKSKSTGGGCNKGHMLGSAERTRSSAINRQVFYYTNIAPQYSSGFNTGGGGWNTLEDWIDGQVCADTTYLVIGTYFERFTDGYGETASPKKISFGGRSDVSCPTMFYIAALRTKRGNTGKSVLNCSKDELMCAAFVRAHSNGLKGQKVSSREMMSIADLEKLTGHKFFVNVPNAPKESFTASEWGL